MPAEKKENVKYCKLNEIGKGLPFAFSSLLNIKKGDEILSPSLRDFHVLFFIKKGSGTYMVDFKEYQFEANTIILLSKDQLHYFNQLDPSNTEIYSITFKPEFIYRNESDLEYLFKFDSTSHEQDLQRLNIPKPKEEHFFEMLRKMEDIYSNWDAKYQSKAFYHGLCMLLIDCEMLQVQPKAEPVQTFDEPRKNSLAFNHLVEAHFKKEFKVDFYSDELNIPLKTLSKITREYYHVAPKAFINQRRILEIKRQLRGSSKSAKSIAYELNFDEPTNMFKFFRKHVGLSPSEFRKQVS